MPVEEPLPGGFIAEVVRGGDTVRRTPPPNAGFVAALLRHLDRAGVDLAPRYLGSDERGRQVLGHRDSAAGLLPVAFLDWDLAAPGRRIEDVAFAGWHWAALGEGADPAELGRRCRLLCDAYDAAGPAAGPTLPRADLVDVMLAQLEGTWRGIDAGAERDEPGMRWLRAAGAVDGVRRWQEWLLVHRARVEAAVLA